jgi:5-methylcytosine-specific restriction endonuclease McrA
MYCGLPFVGQDLTLDHVIPKSQGGKNEWNNLVAACGKCNHRKANRTPEEAGMRLIRRPLPANIHTPRFVLKALGSEVQDWGRYLYADSEGEKRFAFN